MSLMELVCGFYSEDNVHNPNRALPSNVSPLRRAWAQSSFRSPRTDKRLQQQQQQQQQQLKQCQLENDVCHSSIKRTTSMIASDNDVYTKSMEDFKLEELKLTRSQQQLGLQAALQAPAAAPQIRIDSVTDGAAISAEDVVANTSGGVATWGTSFERMLQDAAGLQTFAEFLNKEFSAENIYFWTACERYRHLDNEAERVKLAHEIFSKHLSTSGTDPVNIDSQARNLSEEKLQSGARDIFAPAQKQIFNLMKFDSYQRFIRSDLYKSCLEAEEKQQTLPYSGEDLDDLLKTNFHLPASSTKLKKSASNAEDRRRKSLLPWHRKTRSKSRDRNELLPLDMQHNMSSIIGSKSSTLMPLPAVVATAAAASHTKSASLASGSLVQNSLSDLHSSRSSLGSFDANVNGQNGELVCSLCRVILSDGATTIVQTRPDENVGQLVERLLEKRGLTYPYYDVVYNGCTKSIDLQLPAQTLAGSEVLIEQRVAFKLDLPDPKVISVKSKPKKQLHEVIRPILHKYNYSMVGVQVVLRDKNTPLDLNQSVTVADGQRLKIVLTQPQQQQHHHHQDFQSRGGGHMMAPKCIKTISNVNGIKSTSIVPVLAKHAASRAAQRNVNLSNPSPTSNVTGPTPSTLDEITNKVFNELMQGKVASLDKQQQQQQQQQRASDLCSLKSEDCGSENSSIFERIKRRESNLPGSSKLPKLKIKSTSSQHSEDATTTKQVAVETKPKPIIAKLKAGVKLQVTERISENQDELLEGLKRAQLARLEDQRGTEINFELPDFLKNKDSLSAAATKLRKVRANLSPINKTSTPETPVTSSNIELPQPAPRLSITQKYNKSNNSSPMKDETEDGCMEADANGNDCVNGAVLTSVKGPPPLPPKPKVLPIKPSNWGAAANATNTPTTSNGTTLIPTAAANSKIPIVDIQGRKALIASTIEPTATRCAYLDEPSSSFV